MILQSIYSCFTCNICVWGLSSFEKTLCYRMVSAHLKWDSFMLLPCVCLKSLTIIFWLVNSRAQNRIDLYCMLNTRLLSTTNAFVHCWAKLEIRCVPYAVLLSCNYKFPILSHYFTNNYINGDRLERLENMYIISLMYVLFILERRDIRPHIKPVRWPWSTRSTVYIKKVISPAWNR